MRMPAYLSRSRHGIYYYRHPIPRSLHPKGVATAIRFSLGTRDRREALLIAHGLSYVAPQAGRNGAKKQMDYAEFRSILSAHFKRVLEAQKQSIRENGHLSPLVISSFQYAVAGARVSNAETFKEAASSPPLNYKKKGEMIDLAFWRVPERLIDEPDELLDWARAALAAAHRVAAKRKRK